MPETTGQFFDRCRMSMKARAIPLMVMPEGRVEQCRREAEAAAAAVEEVEASPLFLLGGHDHDTGTTTSPSSHPGSSTSLADPSHRRSSVSPSPLPPAIKAEPVHRSSASVAAAAALAALSLPPQKIEEGGGSLGRGGKGERGLQSAQTTVAEPASDSVPGAYDTAEVAEAAAAAEDTAGGGAPRPAQSSSCVGKRKGEERREETITSSSRAATSGSATASPPENEGAASMRVSKPVSAARASPPAAVPAPAPPPKCQVCKSFDWRFPLSPFYAHPIPTHWPAR